MVTEALVLAGVRANAYHVAIYAFGGLMTGLAALLLATAFPAAAGSGVGAILNLGRTNTVDAVTALVTGLALVIAVSGGFRLRVGGLRLAFTEPLAIIAWAVAVAVVVTTAPVWWSPGLRVIHALTGRQRSDDKWDFQFEPNRSTWYSFMTRLRSLDLRFLGLHLLYSLAWVSAVVVTTGLLLSGNWTDLWRDFHASGGPRITAFIVTAIVGFVLIAALSGLGAVAYLIKPLDMAQIVPAVRKALAQVQGQAQTSAPAASSPALSAPAGSGAPSAAAPSFDEVSMAMGVLMHRYSLNRHAAWTRLQEQARAQGRSEAAQARRILDAVETLGGD